MTRFLFAGTFSGHDLNVRCYAMRDRESSWRETDDKRISPQKNLLHCTHKRTSGATTTMQVTKKAPKCKYKYSPSTIDVTAVVLVSIKTPWYRLHILPRKLLLQRPTAIINRLARWARSPNMEVFYVIRKYQPSLYAVAKIYFILCAQTYQVPYN